MTNLSHVPLTQLCFDPPVDLLFEMLQDVQSLFKNIWTGRVCTAGGCKRVVKGWCSCATLVHLLPDLVVLEPQGLFGPFKEHTNKWFYRVLSLGPSFCHGWDFSFLFGKVEFVSLLRLFFPQSCSHLLSHTNYIVTSQQRCLSKYLEYHAVQPPPDTSAHMLSKLSPGMRGQSLLIDHQCWNAR